MGAKSKAKGSRFELEIIRILQESGRAGEKMPLSGALGGKWRGDVSAPVLGDDWRLQAKCRARGFAQLYAALEGHDALVVKSDRRRPLVVLDLRRALEILNTIESRSFNREARAA